MFFFFFFFNDTATTEIYTLSLHDALPIWHARRPRSRERAPDDDRASHRGGAHRRRDARRPRGGAPVWRPVRAVPVRRVADGRDALPGGRPRPPPPRGAGPPAPRGAPCPGWGAR